MRRALCLAVLASGAALAAPTANGRAVFSINSTTPQHSGYTASTNTFAAAAATQTGAGQTWIVDRAAPTRNEHLAGYVTTGGVLYVLRWNGTAWSAEWNVTVGGTGVNGRRFDIAYENTSGDAVVVYSNNTTGANELRYRIWNGTSWTAATNMDSGRLTGTPNAIKLAARRTTGSDELAATIADSNNILTTLIWSGSAWGNEPASSHGTLAGTAGQNDLWDHAYESASGDLLVIFTTSTPQQNHRTYSAGTWGTVTSWATARAAPLQMVAAANPDPASNEILCLFNRSASANLYARVWSGTAFGTQVTIGANGATTAINQRTIAGAWLKSGASTVAIAFWGSTTATNAIDYNTSTNSGGAWSGAASYTGITIGSRLWFDTDVDPQSQDTMMLTVSDSANDLFTRRITWNGTALTWTAPTGGTLTTGLANVTTQNFDFSYDRTANGTTAGTPTGSATGCTQITVSAPYTGDANGNGTTSFARGTSAGGPFSAVAGCSGVTGASPRTCVDNTVATGTTYYYEVTVADTDGVTGTNPAVTAAVSTPSCATTAGAVTVAATAGSCSGLTISAAYTNDSNANNTLSYEYKTPSGGGTWSALTSCGAHQASPYSCPITGLTSGATYDVRVTFVDADGVSGTNPQTVTNVLAGPNCTQAGTVTAAQTAGATPSIAVTAPYTGDGNANNTGSYRYRVNPAGAWVGPTNLAHSASPYSATISSLTCGTAYDVEFTYADADGIGSGTATQLVSNVSLSNCATNGTASATVDACTQITASATFTNNGNGNGSTLFERGPSGTGPWTAVSGCGAVGGASPRICVDTTVAASTTYYYRATLSDPEGVSGTNPTAATGPHTTPACNNPPLTTGVPSAAADSCAQITVSAPFTGDTDVDSSTAFARSPDGVSNWTTVCAAVTGASPRSCAFPVLSNATPYYFRVTFADPDGVLGTNPLYLGPTSTFDCRVAPGAVSAVANSCTQITATATHTGDWDGLSTTAFDRGPTSTGPWTAVAGCGAVASASPRVCVDPGAAETTSYFYRATYSDGSGVNGTNPIVSAASVTTPVCAPSLTVSSGTGQPAGANVGQGSINTVVGKLRLSAGAGSITVTGVSAANTGTAVAGADVQSLMLYDDADSSGTVNAGDSLLAVAGYGGGKYVFSGLTYVVTAPTQRQVLVTLNVANGATLTRTFAMRVTQADVAVAAPATVAATNFPISGNTFTIVAGTGTEGDPTASSTRPMAIVFNPTNGSTVSSDGPAGTTGFRVQAQIYSPSALTSVALSTDNGGTFPTAMAKNANYGGGANDGTWEATVKLDPGAYVLRVRATNASGAVDSAKVQVVVRAKGVGDGNLLVRDNSSQLCVDCHALQTHSSQSTSNKYGSWGFNCRDCHAPHGTTNIYLVRTSITPPAFTGPQAARPVKFSATTGATSSGAVGAQTFVNELDNSGPCQVCHTRTSGPGAVARWRNTGNADTHYDSTSTSPCTDCHAHSGGFAPASCLQCHGTTGAETTDLGASFWSNTIKTTFNTNEWTYSGHGKTTGQYDVTLNPAANLPTAPSPGTSECMYCHDGAVAHQLGTNPFRLRGASDVSGVTAAYSTATPNDPCLNCHNTGSNGVTPTGQVNKNGAAKVDTAHDGLKHTVGSLGGKFCWDCHDPHGDRTAASGNIAMIRANVQAVSDGTYGYLGASGVARAVSYTDQAAGAPGAGRAVETTTAAGSQHLGLCQACHGDTSETYWTKWWNRLGYDDPTGPPNTDRVASAHNATSATTPYCISCHPHAQKFKGQGTCIDCHTGTQPITQGPLAGTGDRRAIVPEFALTWSHKRSAAGAVTKWDCIVCHVEGDMATGDTTAVHANGYVNLRDADTGLTMKGVTFAGAGAGAYTTTATDATFPRFSRNLASATLEPEVQAMMINHCLKCHDNSGALSTAAQVPTTGTAEKPFGTTIAGAAYVGAGVTANGVLGGVADVNESFKSTNSSYHPVTGKQNNWYAKDVRMVPPWDLGVTTRSGTVNATSWGPLLSCWDCHALPTDTGTITQTVTAHGGTATLRGTVTVPNTAVLPALSTNQVTLCNKCHLYYDTCGSAVDACGTLRAHGANSALSSSTNSGMRTYLQFGCNICHSSGWTTAVVRPVRAQDTHGVNALPAGGLAKTGRWSGASGGTPALIDVKPYAFIRDTSILTNQTPKVIGGTTFTNPTCTMSGNAGPQSCNQGAQNYSVGGTF